MHRSAVSVYGEDRHDSLTCCAMTKSNPRPYERHGLAMSTRHWVCTPGEEALVPLTHAYAITPVSLATPRLDRTLSFGLHRNGGNLLVNFTTRFSAPQKKKTPSVRVFARRGFHSRSWGTHRENSPTFNLLKRMPGMRSSRLRADSRYIFKILRGQANSKPRGTAF